LDNRFLFELENDPTFQMLNQQVNSFNTLKILKLENHEIRHSNLLSWLLNPKENHSLGDHFLRKILEHLILIDENSDNSQYKVISEILNHSLNDSYIYREVKTDKNRFIDLLIVNQTLKTVILIENKLYSTESQNQLVDYLDYTKAIFKDFKIIPIYLTLNGEVPSNSEYFILSYDRIQSILETILMLHKTQLNDAVYKFIEDYHEILKEKYYPNESQIKQAIDIYKHHKQTINELYEESSTIHKLLHFNSDYQFAFLMKYKNTIDYIFKHGQNILSYSFEQFIHQQFQESIIYNPHPTVPHLLPPEWGAIEQKSLRESNYWLGRGLIVWFEKTYDNRLRLIAELGPIKYSERISLIENLEKLGLSFKDNSKIEKARFTRFFSKKIDINKWDDLEELSNAMLELYNDSEFTILRQKIASILNHVAFHEEVKTITDDMDTNKKVLEICKEWLEENSISESDYRLSPTTVSFKIPLFDAYKEKLGETRIKWWWDNGPFLFWIKINEDSLYFVLEVGPIEPEKRMILMDYLKEKGIKFNKKGSELESKYTRIFTETVSINKSNEMEIKNTLTNLYENKKLQDILKDLQSIYKEIQLPTDL